MSLENTQAAQNQLISAIGNISASNDPKQIPNDANEQIIKGAFSDTDTVIIGAEVASLGKLMGMEPQEVMARISRETRRQQRADSNVTEKDVMRQMVQSQATLTTPEVKGVGFADFADEEWAFGEDPYYNERYRRQGDTRAADDQTLVDSDQGVTREGKESLRKETFQENRPMMEGITKEVRRRKNPNWKGERPGYEREVPLNLGYAHETETGYDPQRVDTDDGKRRTRYYPTQSDIDNEVMTPRVKQSYESTTGGYSGRPADRDARMRAEIAAEKAAARRLVQADNANFSPEVKARHDAEALIEAVAREQAETPDLRQGRTNIANAGDIIEIKKANEVAHRVRSANDAIKGTISSRAGYIAMDDNGDIVDLSAYTDPNIRDDDALPNNQTTSDQLNAPQTARQWLAAQQPDYIKSETNFGNYPQVDITQETTNFANKVRDISQRLEMDNPLGTSANIRTTEELDNVVNAIVARKAELNQGMYRRNPETGRNEKVADPGINEVMRTLRMSSGDEQRLANAMFQLDAAQRSSVNQNPNSAYMAHQQLQGPTGHNIAFGAREAIDEQGVEIAQLGENQRGKFKGAESEAAQKPYIGQVAGEKPRINRWKGEDMGSGDELTSNLRRQAISRVKPGEKLDKEALRTNTIKAHLVDERESRDQSARADKMSNIIASLPPSARSTKLYQDESPNPSTSFRPEGRRDSREQGASPQRDVYVKPPQGEASVSSPGVQRALAQMRAGGNSGTSTGTVFTGAGGGGNQGVADKGGALVSLRGPTAAQSAPASQYYDGSSNRDVASSMDREIAKAGGSFAQAPVPEVDKADNAIKRTFGDRLNNARQSVQSRIQGMDPRVRRGLTGAAIAGGAALAGKGIYDVTRPEEEKETLMVRYA